MKTYSSRASLQKGHNMSSLSDSSLPHISSNISRGGPLRGLIPYDWCELKAGAPGPLTRLMCVPSVRPSVGRSVRITAT